MRNAQRRRGSPVPNSRGFSIRNESQTQAQGAEGRGYLRSKRGPKKVSSDLLVQSRWRWRRKGTRDCAIPALSGYPHEALFELVALTSRFAEEEIRRQAEMRGRIEKME